MADISAARKLRRRSPASVLIAALLLLSGVPILFMPVRSDHHRAGPFAADLRRSSDLTVPSLTRIMFPYLFLTVAGRHVVGYPEFDCVAISWRPSSRCLLNIILIGVLVVALQAGWDQAQRRAWFWAWGVFFASGVRRSVLPAVLGGEAGRLSMKPRLPASHPAGSRRCLC